MQVGARCQLSQRGRVWLGLGFALDPNPNPNPNPHPDPHPSPHPSPHPHQVSFSSVSKRFVNELNLLLGELGSSKVSFIRCVR